MKTEWKTCAIKTEAVTNTLTIQKIINQNKKIMGIYTENFISKKVNINRSKTLKKNILLKKLISIDSKWKILLEKYNIYNQLEQKKIWKSFITPTQEVALVQHFLSKQSGKRKTGTNP